MTFKNIPVYFQFHIIRHLKQIIDKNKLMESNENIYYKIILFCEEYKFSDFDYNMNFCVNLMEEFFKKNNLKKWEIWNTKQINVGKKSDESDLFIRSHFCQNILKPDDKDSPRVRYTEKSIFKNVVTKFRNALSHVCSEFHYLEKHKDEIINEFQKYDDSKNFIVNLTIVIFLICKNNKYKCPPIHFFIKNKYVRHGIIEDEIIKIQSNPYMKGHHIYDDHSVIEKRIKLQKNKSKIAFLSAITHVQS